MASPPISITPSLLLDMMHHDALRAVLLWTRASDHLSLRLTCRRVREILDSSAFRLERCQGGFAEIKAVLAKRNRDDDDDMEEEDDHEHHSQYDAVGFVDDEFGWRTNDVTLVVDGRSAGRASFTILPRRNVGDKFHYIADGLSGDLVEVAVKFFDGRGRPKLACLKEALMAGGTNGDNRQGLLYLDTFRWNDPVYNTTSWVGAKALRALFTETALLHEWSVVVYIPESKAQFGKEEKAAKEQYWADKNRRIEADVVTLDMVIEREVEQKKKDKAWHAYCNVFAKRDMLQFLRAGFRQEQETITKSTCFYVYAVPSHLDQPLLSHNDTMSIPILEKPADTREDLCHDALKLVETMKMFCVERQALVEKLLDAQQQCESPLEHSMYKELMRLTDLGIAEELAERNLPNNRPPYRPSPELELKWMKLMREVGEEKKLEVEGKIQELEERVRSETVDLIKKAGTEIIASSDVLHTCAYNLEPGFLRMVVATIPERENQLLALNAFNREGQTPLMKAAVGSYSSNTLTITENRFKMCQALMDLGANKSIVDAAGLTALGVFRKHCRDLHSFQANMGGYISASSQAAMDAIPAMEALLLPLNGATAADDDVLKEPEQEEDNDEDEWDDEDEMEEGDY